MKLGEHENMVVLDSPDGEIGIYYRQPTTKEVQRYQSALIQNKRNKIVHRHAEAQLKYGEKIMTGIREGDFEAKNDAHEWVKASSNPQSADYREDWRDLMVKHAHIHICGLAAYVFGSTEAVDNEEDVVKN